ncbi:MAG: hypothetical protein V4560_09800 [Bacteroidota bacterium]
MKVYIDFIAMGLKPCVFETIVSLFLRASGSTSIVAPGFNPV